MHRVLIVEDDPMVAMINEQFIKKDRNFRIVGKCTDGIEALQFLEEHGADLLVMDVYMPQMDGFETLREIRSRQIPVEVIMVTAANDANSLEQALHLGVLDYLVKPFTFDRFSLALGKYLSQSRAVRATGALDQSAIDHIMENTKRNKEEIFPKGIQEKTLHIIMDYLKGNPGKWFTGEEIAEHTGFTAVTIRRYMNYLDQAGHVVGRMNYETGGRPCMEYKGE